MAAGGVFAWRFLNSSDYEQAVAWMPAPTLRATYTDWSQVRSLADGTALGPDSTSRQVRQFIDRGLDQDLVSTSAVAGSTYAMAGQFGFSPLDASWEMFGQSREGAVVAMKLGDGAEVDAIEQNLRDLGYEPPAGGSGEGGVWAGSVDLVAQIDPTLTPVLQNVAVLPDERVVLMSDDDAYASSAADVVRGTAPSLTEEVEGVTDLAGLPEEPVSAVLFAADFACEDLSMGTADDEDQRVAAELVAEAGGVNPLSGLVMAQASDRSVLVGMHFESSDQAADNLQPRVDLASGEAVGQGGTFPDRFTIESATASGSSVVLELQPVEDEPLLSDISHGPVLFATC